MFRNYLKTAFRNLLRYKGFSLINIASLAIGLVGCLVIALFVWDEHRFDRFVAGGENVYRLYEERNDNSNVVYSACVPPAFGSFLKKEYPEVETSARMLMSNDRFMMQVGDKKGYENKGCFVENDFFKIFPLRFIEGDPATALSAPKTIVITEELARRYFGKANPVGSTIFINRDTLEVKGVLADLPAHFHLNFRYLISLSSAGIPQERMEKWTWTQFYTYVKLKPGTDATVLQNKFQGHVKTKVLPTIKQAGSTFLPLFQPLHDIHLKSSDFVYDNAVRGNETYVKALSIIALFVLVIACFNFINLATARSLRRAKEIGVRKVIGAGRRQLILQFIGETVLLSLISMLVAVAAAFLIIPWLNQFTGKTISFNPFTNPALGGLILSAGLLIGVLAGIYPALVLSGFQPIRVLKSLRPATGGSASWLRHSLVVVQFSLSVLLIVSAIIVYRQTKYLNNKDLGFSKDQVVYFQVRDSLASNRAMLEAFKSELRASSNIMSVTSGYGLPGDLFAGESLRVVTSEGEKEKSVNMFLGDQDYIKTLGLRILAGRDFSRNMATDEREAFIINETAVKEWGLGNPEKALGQMLRWEEWAPADTSHRFKEGRVIGVVQDFHYKNLHEKVTASVIQLYPPVTYTVAVKLRTADVRNTMAFIQSKWNVFSPSYPLDYKFMDETYGTMYRTEEKLSSLLWIFTIMAIFIGCMGLFGLAAFSAEQRTKEIGIRKVLGASLLHIIGLLCRNFLLLVLVSSLIAMPVAWWAMNSWLEDFPYRVAISWWVFGLAVAAAVGIALITVSFQSVKAAMANPIKSLRTE